MISVILPTRGLLFTEVLNSVIKNLRRYDYQIHSSFTLGIPDGHNFLVDEALREDKPDYLLFVEEDTVMPDDTFHKMMETHKDIVFVDYGVQGWSCSAKKKDSDKILWCGLGCTLVKREVFKKLDKPYFRTDKTLDLNSWKWVDLPEEYVRNKVYGGQDIWFFCQAREKGFEITKLDGECKHLQIAQLGVKEYNNGLHSIIEKPRINKQNII